MRVSTNSQTNLDNWTNFPPSPLFFIPTILGRFFWKLFVKNVQFRISSLVAVLTGGTGGLAKSRQKCILYDTNHASALQRQGIRRIGQNEKNWTKVSKAQRWNAGLRHLEGVKNSRNWTELDKFPSKISEFLASKLKLSTTFTWPLSEWVKNVRKLVSLDRVKHVKSVPSGTLFEFLLSNSSYLPYCVCIYVVIYLNCQEKNKFNYWKDFEQTLWEFYPKIEFATRHVRY